MMPLDLPDLKLLQLFDLLYDTRSVTRVAEQLGQSQPTISIWLGRLREHLQDPLFIRTPGGMAPTPQADALIGPCREILESLRRFVAWEIAFDPATAQRRFRICMTDASHITLLPRLLAHVRAQAPGIRLEAAGIDGNTERALESGEADLAIGYVPWLSGGIYQQQLYQQDWVCLTNRHHPRVRGRLGLKKYRSEGHVAIESGTGAQLLEQALARERIERDVVLQLPGFLGLGTIVQTTDLVATLPRHIGETLAQANDLAVHSCPIPVDGFAVRQHWHPRYHQEAGNRWLRGVVVQLFGVSP
ncbi:TPA: LysR family transcriptional regulator [Burkholderia aenigmatica]|uniref:LysR family transcriptional regulator n=1 Tax=Burkholderia sp. AU45251 TaxID=3059204 RepID=UPI00264EB889|nr:LysR family transcriptional regulator [Burkholderia sp. AU45251]HDR9482596.1 LysR family transcriptional regulator [Burkholderia aenigmatica]MDN7517755.1 LysR family transcriptional regulator [Burkholderia sp. AU45251]HDR9513543.1 LysR family transcriptional regulator [Burkholderia aenigmatica]HDR9590934.1 LysR family transcriptional regulator [Burkholderia aenigmatica]HDR9601722.1 LysR family transcriptional regulator [Burkholderia aenigmatica]